MISLKEIGKVYDSKGVSVNALKSITLTFPEKGFVSILGPSGCGKSTLLNIIGLLDKPTHGDIYYNDVSLIHFKDVEADNFRNETIGFIFQSYHLIPTLNVLDNILLPINISKKYVKSEAKEKALELLKKLGLEGYEKKKISQLSGGQIQRISIARALINEPKVILGDEPTGALDSNNSEEILKILKKISEERLVIIVTHNEEQANKYSDRIIRLKDGEIEHDSEVLTEKPAESLHLVEEKKRRKPIGSKTIGKISIKNFFSKKVKAILTAGANCFGLVALGFVFALTNGFEIYKTRVNRETAANLPINVPAYSTKTDTEKRETINQSTSYPSEQEIYPYVKGDTQVTYTYNKYTPEYFNFLDSLVNDGLATEYISNYGNAYSYNLATTYPDSLDGKKTGGVNYVSTTISSGGSYTSSKYGIPTNIFHQLYGDVSSGYDLIKGELPKNKNELVLVVDEYNAVGFEVLQSLGFYNTSDNKNEVRDLSLKSKVKPISFDDVIGKTYKIFTNNEIYRKIECDKEIYDLFSYKYGVRVEDHKRKLDMYAQNSLSSLFSDASKGTELKITGILRPKRGTTITLLEPSLCYTKELITELVNNKADSSISKEIKNNVVYINDNPQSNWEMAEELNALLNKHDGIFTKISATEFSEIADKYFRYYYIDEGNLHESNPSANYRYTSFSNFLYYSNRIGAELVLDETRIAGSSGDNDTIKNYLTKVIGYFGSTKDEDIKLAYEHFISIMAFMNSYTNVVNVAVFPYGLEERTEILARMDEWNARQTKEENKIYYYDLTNSLIREIGELIGLITLILTMLVVLLLIVACVMNMLFTYNNVLEKTKDIGIFRAIGMKKFDVVRIFIFEATIVGAISSIIGIIFTYIINIPINALISEHYSRYFITENLCVLEWWHVIIVFVLGVTLGVISSFIPSLQASRKDPVKCLKDE